MNERIKELAVQAGATFVNDLIELSDGQLMMSDKAGVDHTDMDLAKFAELIVRACAEVIDAQKPVWQNTDVPAEIALNMTAKNVKAYFGVK